MMGHTNTATINQRRPLTAGSLQLLRSLDRKALPWADCDEADKNRLRGLRDRGYATCDSGNTHVITDAGRAALDAVTDSTRIS